MGLGTKTYWLTDRQSQYNFDFDLILSRTSCSHVHFVIVRSVNMQPHIILNIQNAGHERTFPSPATVSLGNPAFSWTRDFIEYAHYLQWIPGEDQDCDIKVPFTAGWRSYS
jgi:hypothetical protein